jgi:uncharacterized coiled-coil protein SlyX
MKKLVFGVLIGALALLTLQATAQAATPTLARLAKTVAKLQSQVNSQSKTIASLNGQLATATSTIGALQTKVSADSTAITALKSSPVMALDPYVTVSAAAINGMVGPTVVLQGVNLQVRSTTSEGDTSGLGNLIVGWNDSPSTVPTPFRTGSNNLVVGDVNNFTSYGGFAAGLLSSVTAPYASVSGGSSNTASGYASSVSGGLGITASADTSWAGGAYHTP